MPISILNSSNSTILRLKNAFPSEIGFGRFKISWWERYEYIEFDVTQGVLSLSESDSFINITKTTLEDVFAPSPSSAFKNFSPQDLEELKNHLQSFITNCFKNNIIKEPTYLRYASPDYQQIKDKEKEQETKEISKIDIITVMKHIGSFFVTAWNERSLSKENLHSPLGMQLIMKQAEILPEIEKYVMEQGFTLEELLNHSEVQTYIPKFLFDKIKQYHLKVKKEQSQPAEVKLTLHLASTSGPLDNSDSSSLPELILIEPDNLQAESMPKKTMLQVAQEISKQSKTWYEEACYSYKHLIDRPQTPPQQKFISQVNAYIESHGYHAEQLLADKAVLDILLKSPLPYILHVANPTKESKALMAIKRKAEADVQSNLPGINTFFGTEVYTKDKKMDMEKVDNCILNLKCEHQDKPNSPEFERVMYLEELWQEQINKKSGLEEYADTFYTLRKNTP